MKAQVSIEFIVYVAVLLLISFFAAIFAAVAGNDIITESINVDAKRVAGLLATEINTAVEVGDGYSRTFLLPEYLYQATNYTADILYQRAYILWNNRSYSLPVLSTTTGQPVKGYNTIRNAGGVIIFD